MLLIGSQDVYDLYGLVLQKLLVKSVAELTGGNKLTLSTRKWACIYRKCHFKRGFAYLYKLKRLRSGKACYGVAYRNGFSTGEANDVANLRLGYRNSLKTVELIDGNYLGVTGFAVAVEVAYRNSLTLLYRAALNSTDTDFSDISDVFSTFNIIIELFEKIFSLFGFMKV